MKKVLLINAHQPYEGIAAGGLNKTLAGVIQDSLQARGFEFQHTAIADGYANAFSAIFDSNLTSIITGVILLLFGTGPIKGFAVVHCLGILTSMFSAVFFSRGLVNLWYGRHKKIQKLAIGQVWRPQEK